MTHGLKTVCARLGVVAMVALGGSACSSIPDWVDPTTWVGGGSGSSNAGPAEADVPAGETPDLASIPDRPDPTSSVEEQQQVAQSLQADSTRAKYSADALRGGTEPVAAPPPPADTRVASAEPPPATTAAPPPATPAPAPVANGDINAADTSAPPSSDVSVASTPDSSSVAPAANPMPAPQMASAAPPPAQSAMPTAAQINPSDAALGFKPSTAPPLDPTIAQFVPGPIIARYDQTASQAGLTPTQRAIAQAPAARPKPKTSRAMGGPETMSGSVVANLDAIQTAPASADASVYANPMGLPPASIVFFPGDGTLVNAEGRLRIRAAVEQFKQRGGTGFIRIVGHASSRTSNMPVEKHLEVIFDKSQDRANAVAKEIIKEGVPASHVLVEAVGDSQPVYYESMPKGEDGNRRAEIFLQS